MGDRRTGTVVRMDKHTKPRRRIPFKLRHVLVLAVVVWGAYTYWFVQRPLFEQQAASKVALDHQLQVAKLQTRLLTEQIKELHSNRYIAQLAEKKYNLIQPGEILFTTQSAGN